MDPNQSRVASILCPVCAYPVAGDIVTCDRCFTLHHEDCARFVGRCATFGCAGLGFTMADPSSVQVVIEEVEIDPHHPTDVATRPDQNLPVPGTLNRGVVRRFVAASQLIVQNPSISLPVFSLLFFFALWPTLTGSAVANILNVWIGLLAQGILVIGFMARARGKESNFHGALALARSRGMSIAGWWLIAGISTAMYTSVGFFMTIMLATVFPPLFVFGIPVIYAGLKRMIAYSLVPVVTAMGPDEEPGNPLMRSLELVDGNLAQAIGGFAVMSGLIAVNILLLSLFEALGGALLVGAASCLVGSAIGLLMGTYWFLFYIEARRAKQRDYLPYAPRGFVAHTPSEPAAIQ